MCVLDVEFYRAPLTLFCLEAILFCMFLLLFSFATITPTSPLSNRPTTYSAVSQILADLWMFTMVRERAMTSIKKKQEKKTRKNKKQETTKINKIKHKPNFNEENNKGKRMKGRSRKRWHGEQQ